MRAWRYFTIVGFAAWFGVLMLGTSIQAQECSASANRGRGPLHLSAPYTVEYRDENGRFDAEGRPAPPNKDVTVVAEDSQGRFYYHWTSDQGHVDARVYDPVAGQEILWGTNSTRVRVVKYATPVAGRRSCWQSRFTDRSAITGHVLRDGDSAFCAPAGQDQPWGCRDVCEAERLAKALPAEKKGFQKCQHAPGGASEELGMGEIQGVTAFGCRTTMAPPNGQNVVVENWSDEYGLTLRQISEWPNGLKSSRDLIRLSREEPDASMFQIPKGYEVVNLEFEEVPCE